MFKFLLYQFGLFVIRLIPLETSFKLARFFSGLQYYFSPRDRKAVHDNIKVILKSSNNLETLTKEVFQNFGQYLVEFFRMPEMMNDDYIREHIKIDHIERLEQVLAKGKGAIIITAHIGNWELGSILLGMMGYRLVAVALPHKERPVNDLFNNQRAIRGVTVVPSHYAVRRCLETLHKNGIIALVADRDFGLTGEVLDFFGRKTLIPKGPAIFSYKTGAPVVPMFLIREGERQFRLMVADPIYPEKVFKGEIDQDLLKNFMKKYIGIIEDKILKYPSQWLMFRKFWIDDLSKIKGNLKT